jgi:hypothetical protein
VSNFPTLNVPDKGYYSNVPDKGYYSNVPDKSYVVLIKYTHPLYNHMQMFDHFNWKYILIISHLHIIVTGQICIMLTKVKLFTSA